MNENNYSELKKGETAAKYSIIANLLLTIMKAVVGILSGSIALLADAIHSLSDILASLSVYIGLKLSQKQPDQKFPYGYYKFETLSSLIISVIIVLTGLQITIESINSIITPKPITIPLIAIMVALISVLVSFLLAKYKDKVGTEIGSPALINDGKHSFVDIFSSLIVFFGILSAYIGYPAFQGVAGFIVALLIIYIGIKFGKEAVLVLMDANLDPKTVKLIQTLATDFDGVKGAHDIKVRRSGPYEFIELHLEIEKILSVQKANLISKSLEKKIKTEIKDIDSIIIKIEPENRTTVRIAVPIDVDNGLNSGISEHFGKAPYFLIVEIEDQNYIKNFNIMKNPAVPLEQKRGIKAVEFLKEKNIHIVLFNGKINLGPSYALSDKSIYVVNPEGKNLKEMLINAAITDKIR